MKSVFVKHAYGDVYDAFWDSGWTHWTRFLFRKNEVTYIKGRAITQSDKQLLGIVVNSQSTENEAQAG